MLMIIRKLCVVRVLWRPLACPSGRVPGHCESSRIRPPLSSSAKLCFPACSDTRYRFQRPGAALYAHIRTVTDLIRWLSGHAPSVRNTLRPTTNPNTSGYLLNVYTPKALQVWRSHENIMNQIKLALDLARPFLALARNMTR